MPGLLTGAPSGSTDRYLLWQTGGVQVFYPARLQAKPDESRIRIRLRKFAFLRWLEIDGARAIVSAPAEEPRAENPPLSPFHKGG